ncbi:MAG: hypothetical protein IPP17_26825 [Bacteroidetes bacterium]|nr:hypothetical protein [Bacteroidota bacterium]
MNEENVSKFWDELVGRQLSSVEFVQDYLQLRFDGPSINVTNPLTVKENETEITSWNAGFRDLLCSQITKIVQYVTFEPEKALTIRFIDNSQIAVSVRPEDYSSPEAISAYGFSNNNWLVE